MPNLKTTVARLAETFAVQLVAAVRGMSLEEILGASATVAVVPVKKNGATSTPVKAPRSKGRLARRSAEDIAKVEAAIVALVKASKGIGAEQIRAHLKLTKAELASPINAALAAKKLRKTGQKRATKYYAGK